MPEVRLRPKGQVTIPATILESAHIEPNTFFDVDIVEGVITLTPKADSKNREDIMSFARMFKNTWVKTPDEVNKTLDKLRDEWER